MAKNFALCLLLAGVVALAAGASTGKGRADNPADKENGKLEEFLFLSCLKVLLLRLKCNFRYRNRFILSDTQWGGWNMCSVQELLSCHF